MLPRPSSSPVHRASRVGSATGGRHADTLTAPVRPTDPASWRATGSARRPAVPRQSRHRPSPAPALRVAPPDVVPPSLPRPLPPVLEEPAGGHRRPRCGARRRPAAALQEPQRTMQLVLSGLGALIMAGICGLSGFFVVADERHGKELEATVAAAAARRPARDISSRTVDPQPLTIAEVFPQTELRVPDAAWPYRIHLTHADTDCHLAASGEVATLLDSLGCSQVVRATMTAQDERYLITSGAFNLADEPGTTSAHDRIKTMLDAGSGRLSGMVADETTAALDTAPAQFGWHTRGHFLVYCVVVRADRQPVSDDDPVAGRILYELVERHLRQTVLGRRMGAHA